METQAYLWHYIIAGVLLAVFGVVVHVCRAVFNLLPDRLSDKRLVDLLISDGYNLGDMLLGTEYDDAGYYRLDSARNLRNAVVCCVLTGYAVMLLAPHASGFVAYWIDETCVWLWQLFLYRLRNPNFF